MYVLTAHHALLAIDGVDGRLTQVDNFRKLAGKRLVEFDPNEIAGLEASRTIPGKSGVALRSGPFAGFIYVKSDTPGCFHLFNGAFVCALPNMDVVCDRQAAAQWETFRFITAEAAAANVVYGEERELATRVRALIDQRRPVCLHFGCGPRRIKGFLNIDKHRFAGSADDYYLFDFTAKHWPIPDLSVDYIYSEDFIEHIPQKYQIAFLAESFRVLKRDAFHRISTPCLADSMKQHSDFTKGFSGVYFGEFDKWDHVALWTRGFINDMGPAIGYRQVYFTAKSCGSSPFAVEDRRPAADRDDTTGNIFVDLLK